MLILINMDVVVKVFGFDACSQFPLPSSEWGKIFVIFGVDNSLSIHSHNIKKVYPNPWWRTNKWIRYCNNDRDFLYATDVKIYQFKTSDSEIKNIHCFCEIFQKTLQLITWKKIQLKGCAHDFSVSYDTINVSDIEDISSIWWKKHNIA